MHTLNLSGIFHIQSPQAEEEGSGELTRLKQCSDFLPSSTWNGREVIIFVFLCLCDQESDSPKGWKERYVLMQDLRGLWSVVAGFIIMVIDKGDRGGIRGELALEVGQGYPLQNPTLVTHFCQLSLYLLKIPSPLKIFSLPREEDLIYQPVGII